MVDETVAPWAQDVEVTDITDTDLEASRRFNTKVSDPDYELHRLVETVRQTYDFENASAAADFVFRIEVAAAIDDCDVLFDRDDYDVAYMIPPAGWVAQQVFETVELVDEDDVDTDRRWIGVSTAPVVHEMAKQAIADGAYESLSGMVAAGCERVLGHHTAS